MDRGVATLLVALLLAAGAGLAAQSPSAPEPSAPPAQPVVAIELASDSRPPELDQLPSLLAFELGQPLTEEAVRRTLTNLVAAGVANEVEILTRPAAGGVVVVVALWPGATVEAVRIEGELGLRRSELERVVPPRRGQPLLADRVLRGVYRLQDLYEERGYLAASVRLEVGYLDPQETEAEVVYRVDSGRRTTVGGLTFEGDTGPFTAEQLTEALGMKVGDPYRRRAVRDAGERLARWLVKQGYRLAEVETPRQQYDEESQQMALTYPLAVGPEVALTLVGAERKKLEREGLLPFLDPQGYDEALLVQAAERIERYYQARGHYRVEVETAEVRREELLEVLVAVEPGPVLRLTQVRLVGNREVGDETLTSLMLTAPRRLLSPGSGRLVSGELEADLANIRAYYALQGFWRAQVGPAQIDAGAAEIEVTIPIEEGPQRRVASLTFSGAEAQSPAELAQALARQGLIEAGGPFHPVLLEDSLELLRGRYRARGYAQAQISAGVEWNDAEELAAVTIKLFEGPQTVIDRIIVRGNRKTETALVRRSLGLGTGEPASGARLLEAQRRLYRLGIFSDVEVSMAPAPPGAESRDVVARVVEGKSRRLSYGLGYDTEDGPRGLVGYSDGNVLGRAFTFRSDLRLSDRDSRGRIAFDQPFVGRYELPLSYTLFYVDEERTSFDVTRWGGRVELTNPLAGNDRFSLIADYRVVDSALRAGFADDPEFDIADTRVRISSLIPNLLLDRRDDILDPTSGWTSFLQLQYAFPFLGTDEEFVKLFTQHTGYFDLGPVLLAASLRLGGIEALTDTEATFSLPPPELPSSRVAISERFFAGGSSSHRAYRRDQLGVLGETTFDDPDDDEPFPVGGNGLLLANLDLRIPIWGELSGVLFADAGNVWADWRDIDPAEAKLGLGVGVRYRSPIGVLRLEVGWKLDREAGESPTAFFLSVGNPF